MDLMIRGHMEEDLTVQLRGVFELCDPAGSGFISLERLLDLGTDLLDTEEAQEFVKTELQSLDPEGSGKVDFAAFCRAVSAVLTDESATPPDWPSRQQQQQHEAQHHVPCRAHEASTDDELEVGSSDSNSPLSSRRLSVRSARRPRAARPRGRPPPPAMLSTGPAPAFIVTASPTAVLDEERLAEEAGSLTDMDSALGTSSPSLEIDGKNRNNSSSSQCSSMSDGESYECLGEGSPAAAVSPAPNNKGEPGGQLRRNTWSRSSLRRTPQSNGNSPASGDSALGRRWGSFRHASKRIAGSNALPSPLYRSASFNSSGRSSNCGDPDDMYCSDASLEEDVMGLNRKVHMLQQQVTALADTQHNTDDRYGRARQENAVLQARVMILEEQLREEQVRGEERLQEEQRRHRELLARLDREKQLELENSAIRLQGSERKAEGLSEEVARLRAQVERQASARRVAEEALSETEATLHGLRSEHEELQATTRRQTEQAQRDAATAAQLVDELRLEAAALRGGRVLDRAPSPAGARGPELEAEVRVLREESRTLREALEEAQAQLLSRGLEQGRTLLGEGARPGTSLADELEAMSADKLGADTKLHLEQVRVALREQQEVNLQLRSYIDGILLNIVENYPQLLEVKTKK